MSNVDNAAVDPTASAFLSAQPAARRAECEALAGMMRTATGTPGAMWGAGIVGFGRYRYRHASGRTGEAALVGFAPRARELVLYLGDDVGADAPLLARLGPHRAGKGCVYLRSLEGIDRAILRALIESVVARRREAA